MSHDEKWMERALWLAEKGEGLTRPNPPVGAVVVRKGSAVGEGFHRRAGYPHAEQLAIGMAGGRAAGATLYVTLEPCCTAGKTPPCTDRVVESGISRVVVSARDPNPAHRGKGLRILKKRGIDVAEGVCAEKGLRLITPFAKWIATGRPYVTLKLAMSLDGKIADYRGHSRWITGTAARAMVQDMRRRADAVIVGSGTVLSDDPSLLPRPARGRRPFRVIIDAVGSVKTDARVLSDDAKCRTIMATTPACAAGRKAEWAGAGASVWTLRGSRRGVSLNDLLDRIGRKGLLNVLCEGGSEIASEFIRAGLVDEYVFFLAPRIVGGAGAKGAVGGRGWRLESSPGLMFTDCSGVGKDIMIRAAPGKRHSGKRGKTG